MCIRDSATLDLLILGTMMDILVGVVFVVLTVREHKYVRIKMGTDS